MTAVNVDAVFRNQPVDLEITTLTEVSFPIYIKGRYVTPAVEFTVQISEAAPIWAEAVERIGLASVLRQACIRFYDKGELTIELKDSLEQCAYGLARRLHAEGCDGINVLATNHGGGQGSRVVLKTQLIGTSSK